MLRRESDDGLARSPGLRRIGAACRRRCRLARHRGVRQTAPLWRDPSAAAEHGHFIGPSLSFEWEPAADREVEIGFAYLRRIVGDARGRAAASSSSSAYKAGLHAVDERASLLVVSSSPRSRESSIASSRVSPASGVASALSRTASAAGPLILSATASIASARCRPLPRPDRRACRRPCRRRRQAKARAVTGYNRPQPHGSSSVGRPGIARFRGRKGRRDYEPRPASRARRRNWHIRADAGLGRLSAGGSGAVTAWAA